LAVVDSLPWETLSSPEFPHAGDELVVTYGYLCRRAARKFWRAGLERCDLEQVGAIGLLKAARRYDPAMRTPFEAYAWMMVVGELMHYVRDHERPIRVPRRLRSLERRYLCAHDTLIARLGREPSDVELADELGVLRSTVGELRQAREMAATGSLADAETIADDDRSGLGFEDRVLVDASFRSLGETERRIIVGVYVLGLSQLEMSRRLGISPKRVSRAHHAALGRMQRAWAS
jgi:RNA polymerase sigma-B factor